MADNISIGYGLMLQGDFEKAIDIFSKEYDSLTEKLNAQEKKDVLQAASLSKKIEVIYGYLFWAFGMAFWLHGKVGDAEDSFRKSRESLGRASEGKAMPYLMEHLLTELRRGGKPLDMDSQLKFMNEWKEKHKHDLDEEETGTEKPAGPALMEKIWDRLSVIEENVSDVKSKVDNIEYEGRKELGREKRKINFTETEVQRSGKKPFSKDNPLILAEYIILREKVHWLWAFVILPEFETEKPKSRFKNYVSKKKAILEDNGIKIASLKNGEDDYAKFEGIEDKVESNIRDVKTYYNKAISLFGENKRREAIKQLSQIFNSNYRWYSFTDAYMRLIEWIRFGNFEEASEKLVNDCRDFLSWYEKRLEVGISRIEFYNKLLSNNKSGLDQLSEQEFLNIKNELRRVEESFQALVQKVPLSKEDKDYEIFVKFLIAAQEKLSYIWEEDTQHEEFRQEASIDLIDKLQGENIHLKEIINRAFAVMGNELYKINKRKISPDKILREQSREIYWFIRDLIIELRNFDEFELKAGNKFAMLISYFDKGLENRIKKWLRGRL